MTGLLVETLLLRWQKIPFTCGAPPFKETTLVRVVLCILGAYAFSAAVPALERSAFDNSFPYIEVIAALLLGWAVTLYALRRGRSEPERRLVFEDRAEPAVEVLELTFRR